MPPQRGNKRPRAQAAAAPAAAPTAAAPEEQRSGAAVVALPDGRAMVVGGIGELALASVDALAADGSGWSALAPLSARRFEHAAVVLPCGKVLVAGGYGYGFARAAALKGS